MKIKEDFMLRSIADVWLVIPVGARVVDFSGMITLSETGAFLWKLLEKNAGKDEMLASLLIEYDIDSETAAADIDNFLEQLDLEGILC